MGEGEREIEKKRARESKRGCVCIGACQQGLHSLVVVVPHCSTVRHPEGYTDNKAAAKFGQIQWFMLTFANSLHMVICVCERFSRELLIPLHFLAMKLKFKMYSTITADKESLLL